MKAVFIDSKNKTVIDVEISSKNTLQEWYIILGVSMVETAFYIDNHDSILVDEEGLLKPLETFFSYEGAHQPFAGNGLIVGTNRNGDSVSSRLTAKDVIGKIKFPTLDEVKQSL